ncbi:MAG: Arc family DNA-binding protein [Gemmatimonadota bacterium]|jgi:plasmid stability protein
MPVNLSIKNVPEAMAHRLKMRAERAHRSLQGELMAILEEAVYGPDLITPSEALSLIQSWGLDTAPTSADLVRADRDAR